MEGFDVNRFIRERRPVWEELDRLLTRVSAEGRKRRSLAEMRRLGELYRGVSSDLIRARSLLLDASITDYLNDLVARAYAYVYGHRRRQRLRVLPFLLHGFPRLVREERRAIGLSALLFFLGAALGANAIALDPASHGVMIPGQHQAFTPRERVSREEETGGLRDANQSVAFSSFLFTHNIKVTFLVFALGITFGVGSAALMFYNGVPLGALAMQYHLEGEGLFFWAWILPHGIPELTEVIIAGGAGLIVGRGLLFPGDRPRGTALREEARRAVLLILGGMPILVFAGLVEGSISQMHAPLVPYWLKLTVAGIVGLALSAYLLLGGRSSRAHLPTSDRGPRGQTGSVGASANRGNAAHFRA